VSLNTRVVLLLNSELQVITHLVFSAIKLMAAIKDLISAKYLLPLSSTILIDRQEEWEVKNILDS